MMEKVSGENKIRRKESRVVSYKKRERERERKGGREEEKNEGLFYYVNSKKDLTFGRYY